MAKSLWQLYKNCQIGTTVCKTRRVRKTDFISGSGSLCVGEKKLLSQSDDFSDFRLVVTNTVMRLLFYVLISSYSYPDLYHYLIFSFCTRGEKLQKFHSVQLFYRWMGVGNFIR